MAILVRYQKASKEGSEKSVYLDYSFYKMIFNETTLRSNNLIIVKQIALLRYKSLTLELNKPQLELLTKELQKLSMLGYTHYQIDEFTFFAKKHYLRITACW